MSFTKVLAFTLTFGGLAAAVIVATALVGGTGLYGALLLATDFIVAVSGAAVAAVFTEWLRGNETMLRAVVVTA